MTNYEKNMEAMKIYPNLHHWLKEQKKVDWIEPLTKTKKPNLLVRYGSKSAPMHSLEDPVRSAKESASAVRAGKNDARIIIGMGLGYEIQEYLKRKKEKDIPIVVVEPVAHIIKKAFELYDYSNYITSTRLIIAAPGKEEASYALSIIENRRPVASWLLQIAGYAKNRQREYGELTQHVSEIVNTLRCNTGTVSAAGMQIALNDIENLPFVIKYRGVNELKDLFKAKPAVMVCTGPSLTRNIHLLKPYQGKVIIIAAAQALRPLLAHEITPDLICTVDFGEVNQAHLDGLMGQTVPMVCLNRTWAPLIKEYSGMKFISAAVAPGFEDSAHDLLKDKGCLEQGGSVAHMVFQLALHMGCEPIILIGQDLAISDKSHTPLADAAGTVKTHNGHLIWNVKDPRCSLSNGEGKHSMGPAVPVPGYYGTVVNTNVGLASFLSVMQRMVEASGKTIINSTEGGAKIKGTEPMWLDDALEKYADQEIDKSSLMKLLSYADNANELVEKSFALLRKDIRSLKQIQSEGKSALKILPQILKKKNNPKKLKELLEINEEHSKKAQELSGTIPLIALAIYKEEMKIREAEMRRSGSQKHLVKNQASLKIRVKRNRIIINAAVQAAKNIQEKYEEALTNMEILKDAEHLPIVSRPAPPTFDDINELLDAGNWAKPLLDAEKILDKKEDIQDCSDHETVLAKAVLLKTRSKRALDIMESNRIRAEEREEGKDKVARYWWLMEKGLTVGKEKKFEKALEYFLEAKEIKPGEEELLWGIATTYHHLKQYEESATAYNDLINKFPKNIYKFEMGQLFLVSNRVQEGYDLIMEVTKDTDEFDGFFSLLGDIFAHLRDKEKASACYELFIEKFPWDEQVKEKLEKLILNS